MSLSFFVFIHPVPKSLCTVDCRNCFRLLSYPVVVEPGELAMSRRSRPREEGASLITPSVAGVSRFSSALVKQGADSLTCEVRRVAYYYFVTHDWTCCTTISSERGETRSHNTRPTFRLILPCPPLCPASSRVVEVC